MCHHYWPAFLSGEGQLSVGVLLCAGVLTFLAWLAYSIAFAPTRNLPGPWYTRWSSFCMKYRDFDGTKRVWIHRLHLQYGPVVRLAPNEASFASTEAIREIYTTAGGYAKTELYSLFQQEGHTNLFTTLDKRDHNQKKRRFGDIYSNSSILRPRVLDLLNARADLFMNRCIETRSVDVYFYLHCYALDCVTAITYHPYGTESIGDKHGTGMVCNLSYHDSRKVMVLNHYHPWIGQLYSLLVREPMKGGISLKEYAWSSISKKDHADFTLAGRLLQDANIGMGDIVAECLDHIGAGIDTTGDTLCFLMWELSQPRNTQRMERLSKELQSSGSRNQLEKLPYLEAVINEALRLWAPGTLPLPRYVPAGGRYIDGYFLPGGCIVSCQSYTLHRLNENIFENPENFIPERWLADKKRTERLGLLFAFGSGARGCVGKYLALAEMRALLYSVYSKYYTRPSDDMHACMDMSDQLLTSRPQDLCCKLTFEPIAS